MLRYFLRVHIPIYWSFDKRYCRTNLQPIFTEALEAGRVIKNHLGF